MKDIRYSGFANFIVAMNAAEEELRKRWATVGKGLIYWINEYPKQQKILQSQTKFYSPYELIARQRDDEILNALSSKFDDVRLKNKITYRKFVKSL